MGFVTHAVPHPRQLILLLLGCLLERTTILLVIVPVLIPTAKALGIEMVHFGIMVVLNIMIGLITPLYGLLLFIMTRIAEVPLGAIVRDVIPFLFAMLCALAVVTFASDAVLFLPHLFGYTGQIMKPIYILNGPNLNRLGKREPDIYGTTTLAEIETWCREAAGDRPVRFHQTSAEHQLVDWVHEAIDEGAGIVINPAGLSFLLIPLLDALKMFSGPIVELHIFNIHRRGDLPALAGLEGGYSGHRRARTARLQSRHASDDRPTRTVRALQVAAELMSLKGRAPRRCSQKCIV